MSYLFSTNANVRRKDIVVDLVDEENDNTKLSPTSTSNEIA